MRASTNPSGLAEGTSHARTTDAVPSGRSEPDWRREADAAGELYRANPRNPDIAIRYAQALRQINESPYGLQAGLFTRDAGRIFQAFEELEVGGLVAGDVPSFRIDHMPYGGVKDSGLGREGLRYAIEEMTEPRLLVMNVR